MLLALYATCEQAKHITFSIFCAISRDELLQRSNYLSRAERDRESRTMLRRRWDANTMILKERRALLHNHISVKINLERAKQHKRSQHTQREVKMANTLCDLHNEETQLVQNGHHAVEKSSLHCKKWLGALYHVFDLNVDTHCPLLLYSSFSIAKKL